MISDDVLAYIKNNWKNTTKSPTKDIPFPYTSPSISGRYVDFFYWDNYFFNKGLLLSGMADQVENNIKNIDYFINKYGYMPNANCLLNRSQPPVFTLCVLDLFEFTKDESILKKYLPTCLKEYNYFINNRMTPVGLNAYGCTTKDENDLIREYNGLSARVQEFSDNKNEQLVIAKDILAIAESGLDFNMRFKTEKSKIAAHEFAHVDLNSFLYAVEVAISKMASTLGDKDLSTLFAKNAIERKEKMEDILFDKSRGVYADYNFVNNYHSKIITMASIYPQAFGVSTNKEAVLKIVKDLECDNGVSVAKYRGDDVYYQWDYPVMWGESTYICYQALINVGEQKIAERIKNKYIKTVENNFEKTHELWEKYNAVDGSIMNVEYDAPPFMGWTAAIYQYFKSIK